MKIRIGQILRVPPSRLASQPGDFYALSRGPYQTGINPNRGIFYYAALKDTQGVARIPAVLLYSDNLRGLSEKTPGLTLWTQTMVMHYTTETIGPQEAARCPPTATA